MTEDTIRDLLIEIKTKVDILLTAHTDHETRIRAVEQRPVGSPSVEAASKDHEARLVDHETRLRVLEKARWVLVGAAAVIGGVAGKVVGLL